MPVLSFAIFNKHEIVLNFFLAITKPYICPFNFRKFQFFSFDFCQNFDVRTFSGWLSIRGSNFLVSYQKFVFQNFHLGPIRWVPRRCIKIWLFIVKIWLSFGIFELFSKIIPCACWAYVKTSIRPLSIRGANFRACSASGKMLTVFTCTSMLSIRGTNFIALWAYMERISSLAEHTRNWFYRWLSVRGNV